MTLSLAEQRAYEQFCNTFVPWSLDFRFGIINHFLLKRDSVLKLKGRPANYKAISGLVNINDTPYTPLEYLIEIVGVTPVVVKSTFDVLEQLCGSGQNMYKDNVIYLAKPNGDVIAMLTIEDNHIKFVREEMILGLAKLEEDYYFRDKENETDVLLVYPKLKDKLDNFFDRLDTPDLIVVQDDLALNFDRQEAVDAIYLEQIETVTKASPSVQEMCALASQEFVLCALAFRENFNGIEIYDEDFRLEGNCVETSCAIALNSMGG